jgi:hypothetical protein
MQRQTSTNQRDAPGQDTGRAQGQLGSYLLGGGTMFPFWLHYTVPVTQFCGWESLYLKMQHQ